MQVTITPQYIDPPGEGKKNWKVKDSSGAYYSVPPTIAPSMQKGVPVVVNYRVNNFNGKSFNIVESLAGAPTQAPQQPPPQYQSPPAPAPTPAPAGNVAHRNGDTKSREMFIMGVVGRAMGGGNFQATDIKLLTFAAADAWDELARRDAAGGGETPF